MVIKIHGPRSSLPSALKDDTQFEILLVKTLSQNKYKNKSNTASYHRKKTNFASSRKQPSVPSFMETLKFVTTHSSRQWITLRKCRTKANNWLFNCFCSYDWFYEISVAAEAKCINLSFVMKRFLKEWLTFIYRTKINFT